MVSPCNFLSETDEAKWTDCLYASGVMLARDAAQMLPLGLTPAEREALESSDLRPDEQGGSLDDLMVGFDRRYGWKPLLRKDVTDATFATDLAGERGAVVQLIYAKLPVHYRRWDTAFGAKPDSRHSFNARIRSSVDGSLRAGYLWIRDPLGRGTYCGEWIARTDLLIAMHAFNGTVRSDYIVAPVVVPPDTSTEADMFPVVTATLLPGGPRSWRVAGGVTLNAYDPAQPGRIVKSNRFADPSSAAADAEVSVSWQGVPTGQAAPVPKGGPFLRVTNGMFAGLLIVKAQVTLAPAPPAPPDPRVATLEARIAAIKGKVAANAADIADD